MTTDASTDPYRLDGEVAVVTGASSGIGRAIALELAAAGADVVVHAHRSWSAAEATRDAIRGMGRRSEVRLADLGSAEAIDAFVADCDGLLGPFGIWVHNAGADVLTGDAARFDFEAKLELLWRVDVRGSMLATRAAGARLRQRGRGVIITMGWDQATTGMEGESGELFAATKGAVMAYSRSLALSLAPAVRVHCVAPGWIRTAWGESAPAEWQERVRRETPLGRWGEPGDIARLVRFLVSPAAGYLHGQTIFANGGAVR